MSLLRVAAFASGFLIVFATSACGSAGQHARPADPAVEEVRVVNDQAVLLTDLTGGGIPGQQRLEMVGATNDLLDALRSLPNPYRRRQIRGALKTLETSPGVCAECIAALKKGLSDRSATVSIE